MAGYFRARTVVEVSGSPDYDKSPIHNEHKFELTTAYEMGLNLLAVVVPGTTVDIATLVQPTCELLIFNHDAVEPIHVAYTYQPTDAARVLSIGPEMYGVIYAADTTVPLIITATNPDGSATTLIGISV